MPYGNDALKLKGHLERTVKQKFPGLIFEMIFEPEGRLGEYVPSYPQRLSLIIISYPIGKSLVNSIHKLEIAKKPKIILITESPPNKREEKQLNKLLKENKIFAFFNKNSVLSGRGEEMVAFMEKVGETLI